jgi:hypothetical protein
LDIPQLHLHDIDIDICVNSSTQYAGHVAVAVAVALGVGVFCIVGFIHDVHNSFRSINISVTRDVNYVNIHFTIAVDIDNFDVDTGTPPVNSTSRPESPVLYFLMGFKTSGFGGLG